MGDYPHVFDDELKFEAAFVELLKECGWEKEVIKNPTEDDLIDNWAKILFDNNREIDANLFLLLQIQRKFDNRVLNRAL